MEVATVYRPAFAGAGDQFTTTNTLSWLEVAPSHMSEDVVATLGSKTKGLRAIRRAECPSAPAWRNSSPHIAEEFGPALHRDIDAVAHFDFDNDLPQNNHKLQRMNHEVESPRFAGRKPIFLLRLTHE